MGLFDDFVLLPNWTKILIFLAIITGLSFSVVLVGLSFSLGQTILEPLIVNGLNLAGFKTDVDWQKFVIIVFLASLLMLMGWFSTNFKK